MVDEKQLRHDREAAVVSMREQYSQLLPRWQAVVLTAEAEVQAQARTHSLLHPFDHGDTPPWANMKFAGKHTKGADYKEWEALGFVTGEPMDLPALAKFRYQIDLGGAGGTDLAGTLQKLALPGLLFHHMTATKDFLHDWMTPWVHYVPVASDLSDLKDKLAWAESHQDRAKQISDAGTKLVRYLTGPEGLKDMFERAMLAPLRSAVAAYQPLATELLDHKGGGSWAEVIEHMEGKGAVFPVLTCTGISTDTCTQVKVQKEKKKGKKTEKKRKKKR